MAKLRILIVTSWYPNKSNAVSGTFVREQAQALSRSGEADVALFYPSDPEVEINTIAVSDDGGIQTYRANLRFEGNPLKYLVGGLKAAIALRRIMLEYKPDVIHAHVCFPAGILTYLAVFGLRIPFIITEHMSYLHEYLAKGHYRFLLKKAYKKAAGVLVVSPFLGQQFDGLAWDIKLESFPNMVDTERFGKRIGTQEKNTTEPIKEIGNDHALNKSQNKQDSQNKVNILFVGGLDQREIKGLQYLVPALAQVISVLKKDNQSQKPHLHIVGDGVKRLEYVDKVRELGILEYVTFYGAIKPEDMPAMYDKCDFFVLSSLKETFGVVLIEAMASGKPVLATACGGPESIVTPDTGILVEKESVSALTQGLMAMIQNYQSYEPETIRQYAEEHFSTDVLTKKLVLLYRTIIKNIK